MSVFEIGAAAIGFLIIAVTIWKLVRNGIAPSNGKMTEAEDFWIAAPPP